jgi:hypothetical protein
MFDTAALGEAIEELDIPVDGSALAEVFGLRDRLEAKLSAAVGAFDAAGLFEADGASCMTAWLRDRAGRSRRAAYRTVVVATRLGGLPVTAAAWAGGRLCEGQVEAVVANVSPELVELFATHEAEVVPVLEGLSVDGTARALELWRARAAAGGSEPAQAVRTLHLSPGLDGTWVGDMVLDSESGTTVATALRLARTPDVGGEPTRSPATARADALVDICAFFLDHQHIRQGGRHRPHVNVVVDLDELEARAGGRLVDGGRLGERAMERLLCDCALHRMVLRGRSAVLDYGMATRTTPAPLFNALVARDEHCRWPGCDRPSTWCESHHVIWVTSGGPTCMENTVLLCRRHHGLVHRGGWEAKLEPDGTLHVTSPEGIVRTTSPPRAGPRLW